MATAPSARGEEAEVQSQLKKLSSQPAHSKEAIRERREAFRRVVQYMSLGIDMSGAFSGMLSNCASPDPQLKRLLYEYVAFHARSRSDMALLCTNTLQKDCSDSNPSVRSLALRSLASLRFQPRLLEHVSSSVSSLLQDPDSSVRSTAALAALKVHCADPSVASDRHLIPTVESMLKSDRSARVKAACVDALKEAFGLAWLGRQRRLLFPLLNDLPTLSEWAQGSVLDAASCFTPEDDDEAYKLLNAVDDRIDHQNTYVALSAVKSCLHATKSMPFAHQQVYERSKGPLIFLAETAPSVAISHCVTCHLALLAGAAAPVFEADWNFFVPKLSDPPETKAIKLHALAEVASTKSAHEVASELSFSASHESVYVAREAIKALGRLTMRIPEGRGLLDRLFNFLSSSHVQCQDETVVACVASAQADLSVLNAVAESLSALDIEDRQLPRARRALLWLFGAFARALPSAVEKLEAAIEHFKEETRFVKLELLTACTRCFLALPSGQSKALLSHALKAGRDDSSMDVQERAGALLRLLSQRGPEEAVQVVGIGEAAGGAPAAETWLSQSSPVQAFNTLEAVLHRDASDLHAPAPGEEEREGELSTAQQEEERQHDEGQASASEELLIEPDSEAEAPPAQLEASEKHQQQHTTNGPTVPQLLE